MSHVKELYQRVILDHNNKPKNFYPMEDATHSCTGYNPFCGDKLTIYCKATTEGIIEEISFVGSGCAISKASASLMTAHLKGKSIEEARTIFKEFHDMALGKYDPEGKDHHLGKLVLFQGVREFPSRIKCATLSWHTVIGALDGEEEMSTE